MGMQEVIISSIVDSALGLIKDGLVDIFKTKCNSEDDVHERLSQHMREIKNWSKHFQFLQMSCPRNIDQDTVKLNIQEPKRNLRASCGQLTDESVFLRELHHYVLLGEPGSGKTTTLKRLVRRFFEEPSTLEPDDSLQYPVVLLLRHFDPKLGLLKSIAEAIGFEYEDLSDKDSISGQIISSKTMIGDKPIQKMIPAILDSSNAFLLLDGLDEAPYHAYNSLIIELNKLACGLDKAKILITCRRGDFTQTLKGFRILELAELSQTQIEKIAAMWLEDPRIFMEKLRELPYYDMANRPLLLAQLLWVFNYEEELPDEPHKIYRKMTTLLLQEWDRSRGIRRKTKYSQFDPDSKLDFLSALSYEITYQVKTKRFSESKLIACYNKLCQRFRLPKEQAFEVVKEIETHTGIIAVVNSYEFEFSHLSLQEYLCANYIVREPRAGQIPNYLREYPPPLAIAISLAAEPSTWFADLILKYGDTRHFSERSLQAFISRLKDEAPRFVVSSALGYAVLHLFFNFYEYGSPLLRKHLELLTEFPFVMDSIVLAIERYWIEKDRSEPGDYFYLVLQHEVPDNSVGKELRLRAPSQGRFPKNIFLEALSLSKRPMIWCEKWGLPGSRFLLNEGGYLYEDGDHRSKNAMEMETRISRR
jgi:hypothetical protein